MIILYTQTTSLTITSLFTNSKPQFAQHTFTKKSMLPDIVMPLDVNLVEDPLWWFEEVFLHLHGHVPGQQTHQQTLLHE